jgi:DnaJ-class molecular chaperone
MPRLSERGYGDLYVDVHVSTPNLDALNDEQREALETLAGTLGATVQNSR